LNLGRLIFGKVCRLRGRGRGRRWPELKKSQKKVQKKKEKKEEKVNI